MKECFAAGLFVFLFAFTPSLLHGQDPENLISFELEDQFKREYSDKDFRGQMVVLIGSDGGGSSYNGKWGKAISDALRDKKKKYEIHWIGLADLSNAPYFMRGIVRKFFPDDEEDWVLLDWEGRFPSTYGFTADMSNILVFDANGQMVYQTKGKEVVHGEVEKIVIAIIEHY